MNVLSLFDGMSCGQIALDRTSIEYENYYASEIDKYAIQVTQHNYSDTVQLGDIDNWQEWDLPKIDLIIGGSPCQGFSKSGKGLNFDDPRSKLYFVFEDIVKHYQPDYWLLENVVMIQEWQDIISRRMGIRPIMINSALVSAQNRERLYWTNIGNKYDLFGLPYCNISQPKDKGIVLSDIIEDGFIDREKSLVLDTGYQKTSETSTDRYFRKGQRQIVFINQKPRGYNKGGIKAQNGKAPSFTGSSWENNNHLVADNQQWRKLTLLECERLQTVPDNYTLILDETDKQLVSNSQRYKMLGNGWTVDVIAHIFSFLVTEMKMI